MHAAPQEDVQLEEDPIPGEEVIDTKVEADNLGVIVTEPMTSENAESTNYYYPYRQSMSPRAGIVLDPDMIRDGDIPLVLGIRYMIPDRKPPQWEVGFDIVTDEGAHISIGKKFIFNPRKPLRPYLIISGMLAAQAEEKLATITDFENYYIKVSGGFEDVIKMPMSVRLEVELAAGIERQFALISLGYSWGW